MHNSRQTSGLLPFVPALIPSLTLPYLLAAQMTGAHDIPPGAKPLAHGKPCIPYKIYALPNGKWCGVANIPGFGPITACASPTDELKRIVAMLRGGGATSAGLFSFIKKAFKAVAKVVVSPIKRIVGVAKLVARGKILQALKKTAGPIFRSKFIRNALGVIATPFLGPAAAFIPMALKAAGGILTKAKRGNPQAQRVVQQVRQQARRGNPRAQRIWRNMQGASRMMAQHRRRNYPQWGRPTRWQKPIQQRWQQSPQFRQFLAWQRMKKRQKPRRSRFPGLAAYPRARSRFPGLAAYPRARSAGEDGSWVETDTGQVYIPQDTAVSGPLQLGYRPDSEVFTMRDAYHAGLNR